MHHVQRVCGAHESFPCRNFGERDAYDLGGRFLKRQNVENPIPNRNFWKSND